MKIRDLLRYGALVLTLLTAAQAYAVPFTLSMLPEDTYARKNQVFSVDVVVSGLTADVIGAYALEVTYDPLLVEPISSAPVTYAGKLGDPGLFEVLQSPPDLTSGTSIFFSETSFLDSLTLDLLQGDTFVLATLNLRAKERKGTSALTFSLVDFSDADLFAPQPLVPAVNDATVTVPSPSTALLLAIGLMLPLFGRGPRRRAPVR